MFLSRSSVRPWRWACQAYLFLAVLLTVACVPSRSEEEKKDSITYGFDSDIYTFDPIRQRMMKESAAMNLVMEGLTKWNNDIKLVPSLATDWQESDDCHTWTFKLREGVVFHDGTPFNSEAVRAHFYRTKDPANAATRRHLVQHIESIDCPSDLEVVFHLSTPDCVFPEAMASTYALIPSPTATANLEKPFGQNPVGTGPFRFVDWTPDVAIRLEKNQDSWRADQYQLKRLELRPIRENTTRLILLEQGVVDMADVFFAQVNVARQSPHIELQTTPQLAVRYMGFNNKKKPFSDIRVRRAANYAVNREEMIKYQFFGVGMAARGPLPTVMPNHNPDVETYDYNPEKARQLLAEAGYPNGVDVNFWTTEQGEYRVAAEAVGEYLRQVGINVKIVIIDNAAYWKKFDEYILPSGERYPERDGVYDMYLGGWVGGEAEYDYLRPLFYSKSGSNSSFYANPDLDARLDAYMGTPDEETRRRMLMEMQSLIADDSPWIFGYYSQVNMGYQRRVKGFKINPSSRLFFEGVTAGEGED
ncbi:hypothetical protein GC173_09620 [bacterium]|nr:hypothetical protein [bacterium]